RNPLDGARLVSIVAFSSVASFPTRSAYYASSRRASCLPDDSLKHIRLLSVVVAERELREVERKILARDLGIAAHDAALDERPERINARCVDVAAHVLMAAVIHGTVREGHSAIAGVFVRRHQVNAIRNRFFDESLKRRRVRIGNDLRNDLALTRDRAD